MTKPGRVDVVGLGPGAESWITPAVTGVLAAATDWLGYDGYISQARRYSGAFRAGINLHESDNREEADRARHALELAVGGAAVAVLSSGDPGVFAMAAAVMEQLEADPAIGETIEVAIHPGISAAQAAAARVGAPLGHDFCLISLSDNLKPWSIIARRLDAAVGADFVVALYNPRSRARPEKFEEAMKIVAAHRDRSTPIVLGRDVGRADETVKITTVGEIDPQQIDMRTVVIIGSSQTSTFFAAGREWVHTSRRYPQE